MPTQAIPARAVVLLAILTLVWGTNWPLFPIVLREMSVWTFRFVSLGVGGVLLLAVARARGQPLSVPRKHWAVMLASALAFLLVWNVASAYSAKLIPSGQAAVLGFTMPLWAALLAWAFMGQRLSARLLLALGLGVASVALLMSKSFAAYADAPLGLGLGLLAAVGWAVGTLILKRWPIDVPATVLTGWQLLLTAVPIGVGTLLFADLSMPWPSWPTLALLAYITVVPMCIGNLCWFAIVGMLPANVAGLSSVAVPVVAMLAGAVVHGEPLGPAQWLAMACSAAALWLTVMKPAAQAAASSTA